MRTKSPALYLCEYYQESQSYAFLNNNNNLTSITTHFAKGFLNTIPLNLK